VYVYTAARLASGKISFEQVGPMLQQELVRLNYQVPDRTGDLLKGNIPVLDIQYGNVWTNINDSLFRQLNFRIGDTVQVRITHKDSLVYSGKMPFVNTFGDVKEMNPLGYLNSLKNFSLALNMGSFADSFHIKSGKDWSIEISR
jgi:S-adenosylmethionine hydrolase